MGVDELALCEEWELDPPTIPPRSRLFHLEPVGVGTPETESLTGYVARLAEAHGVTTRELVRHEILPFLGREHLAAAYNAGLLSAFWRNETRALNGTRTLARNLVRALETLTGRQNLRFLTLLTWSEVLPVQHLQRRSRAWCPACYEGWRQSGHVVYEPLLWSLVAVTVCPQHRRRLRLVCPYPECRRPSPWLSSRSRSGHCAACGRWLGDAGEAELTEGQVLSEEEMRTQAWTAHAVGELIAAAPDLTTPPRQEQVRRAVAASVDNLTGGNRRAWARRMGLGMETIANWYWGESRPSLWFLLQACSRLGTTPLRFLGGDLGSASHSPGKRPLPGELPHRPPWAHKAIDHAAVRSALEAVLAGDELPPPSLREVAERLGHTHNNLRHHFPELCRAISERFLSYQTMQGAQTRARVRDEVWQATFHVHSQGVYPSACRVAPLLSRPDSMRSRPAREAWHEALQQLGWQT